MPTYAELESEVWWRNETIPAALASLRTKLLIYFGLSGGAIGIKGNNVHLRGYHRSRAWILNSKYCTNRTYSVSRTPGDRAGGDPNWVCGMDVSLNTERLLTVCQRLDAAIRASRLEKITEWYGNKDGDTRVDGYDNISNVVASSDASHLWHLHMSFDRGRANENHDDVFAVMTTPIQSGGIMTVNMDNFYAMMDAYTQGLNSWKSTGGSNITIYPPVTDADLLPLNAKLDTLINRPTSTIDATAFVNALAANPEFLNVLADAIAVRVREAVGDEIKERMQE